MPENEIIQLALVDDHKLFRKGLVSLIEMVGKKYHVLFEADNGKDMQKKLEKNHQPDIILMDVNMPGMDGFASVQWLAKNFPKIKILVLSMVEKEETIVRMLKLGVKGYLNKDVEPEELSTALDAIVNKGFYYTDFITGKLVHSLQIGTSGQEDGTRKSLSWEMLNSKERTFLTYCCADLTYSQIAEKMYASIRTIEGYRTALCEKLQVKSRVGLVLYAIKNGVEVL